MELKPGKWIPKKATWPNNLDSWEIIDEAKTVSIWISHYYEEVRKILWANYFDNRSYAIGMYFRDSNSKLGFYKNKEHASPQWIGYRQGDNKGYHPEILDIPYRPLIDSLIQTQSTISKSLSEAMQELETLAM